MKITIFVNSEHKDVLQDLNWPENHPVGGTETAVLRLAKALIKRGEQVTLMTDANLINDHTCDVFISARIWQVFTTKRLPGKQNYLWCHDDSDQALVKPLADPKLARLIYERIDGVFVISYYQAQRWISGLNLPVQKMLKITNGIPVQLFKPNPAKLAQRKPWAYYASTPFRGLDVLLEEWPSIQSKIPEAELHICSSMKVYSPEHQEEGFSALYQKAAALPNVHYHGSVGQAQLREIAQQCRVLAYPCTFPETSCIVAMEAMAAGCAVVSTTLGALPETAWQNPLVSPGEGWQERWADEVVKVLQDNRFYEQRALQNIDVAKYYDWSRVAKNMLEVFRK